MPPAGPKCDFCPTAGVSAALLTAAGRRAIIAGHITAPANKHIRPVISGFAEITLSKFSRRVNILRAAGTIVPARALIGDEPWK